MSFKTEIESGIQDGIWILIPTVAVNIPECGIHVAWLAWSINIEFRTARSH